MFSFTRTTELRIAHDCKCMYKLAELSRADIILEALFMFFSFFLFFFVRFFFSYRSFLSIFLNGNATFSFCQNKKWSFNTNWINLVPTQSNKTEKIVFFENYNKKKKQNKYCLAVYTTIIDPKTEWEKDCSSVQNKKNK